MIAEINTYLQQENPALNTGFCLFCRYSRNESLMSWIGRKKDMAKLIYELKKINKAPAVKENTRYENNIIRYNRFRDEAPQEPVTAANEEQPEDNEFEDAAIRFKTYDDRKTKRSDLPEDLQAVYDTIAEDYKLRKGYHEKMKMAQTDQDRADFRARIIETQERIIAGWAKIDEYLLSKETQKVESDETFKESSCRSYISKNLKKENISPAVAEGIKIRVKALLDHGCVIKDETMDLLKAKALL